MSTTTLILAVYRQQRKHFDLTTSENPKEALETVRSEGPSEEERVVSVAGLPEGMVVAEDIRSGNGLLLVSAGQPVTLALIRRLVNWANTAETTIQQSIHVTVPVEGDGPTKKG